MRKWMSGSPATAAARGDDWIEREVPLDLAAGADRDRWRRRAAGRLPDAVALNLMHAGRDWSQEAELLAKTLQRQTSPVVLVTNEVGLGIVPDNALARAFRDAAGLLNQRIAEAADEVEFVVAGLPMKVK